MLTKTPNRILATVATATAIAFALPAAAQGEKADINKEAVPDITEPKLEGIEKSQEATRFEGDATLEGDEQSAKMGEADINEETYKDITKPKLEGIDESQEEIADVPRDEVSGEDDSRYMGEAQGGLSETPADINQEAAPDITKKSMKMNEESREAMD